jgi:hypothetical protein
MHRKPRRAARRRATPHRHLFALLALAVAFVQLVGLGHLVFVTHAICEHGALLHVEHEAVAAPKIDDRPAAEDRVAARPGQSADGHHQHCDPFAVRPAVVAVAPSFEAPAPFEGVLLPETAVVRAAFPPIDLLSLAPKSSPPRIASSLTV